MRNGKICNKKTESKSICLSVTTKQSFLSYQSIANPMQRLYRYIALYPNLTPMLRLKLQIDCFKHSLTTTFTTIQQGWMLSLLGYTCVYIYIYICIDVCYFVYWLQSSESLMAMAQGLQLASFHCSMLNLSAWFIMSESALQVDWWFQLSWVYQYSIVDCSKYMAIPHPSMQRGQFLNLSSNANCLRVHVNILT